MAEHGVVIIGAGQAGLQTAISLRALGYARRIALIGNEAISPYQRPPLSKAFLQNTLAQDRLALKPDAFFEENDIELMTGTEVTAIAPHDRNVRLKDGRSLAASHLVLATGARARRLGLSGEDARNVHTLRSLEDARRLKMALDQGRLICVIGGGYIGLEVAATARKLGANVTVIEAGERLLARVAPPQLSAWATTRHKREGVTIVTGEQVVEFSVTDEFVHAVTLSSGKRIACDLVVIGVGAVPNCELATEAGLPCNDGIMTDANGRTADPFIYAAGDCAKAWSNLYARPLRFESVANAIESGKAVAAAIAEREPAPQQTPWNWSDQYDAKIQSAGLSVGADDLVVRGSVGADAFSVFALKDGRLVGADCINSPHDFLAARVLIARRFEMDPVELRSDALNLKELARG
jgi:3-phenylpropionate/trans-cinnamate dioxygenase ferredoxin reductase component